MANEAYKDWYVQGLEAVLSAVDQGKGDPSAVAETVRTPELGEVLRGSSEVMDRHASALSQILERHGGGSGQIPNAIMHGLRAGSREMIEAAKDGTVREASLIAASQLTVHYFIAAYGTLASTAQHLGLEEDVVALKRLCSEMKVGDETLVKIAKGMVNDEAAA